MNYFLLGIVFIVYFIMVGYVGYLAWKRTNSSEDFMIAGRETHPYIMALSYGATFISTAAIVGFGGVAGKYGMGILWLVFLNIFVGVFIAFVFFGKRTRRMGKNLGSLTFPEFLGRRFNSKFIQYFSGILIFCAMPIYAAVVLIGAARFMESSLMLDFNLALLVLAVVICAYVLFGGLKGVMYTDALQGTIMFVGMIILLVFIYWVLGGVTEANTALTNMAPLYPPDAIAEGGTGWTSFLVVSCNYNHYGCRYRCIGSTTACSKIHDCKIQQRVTQITFNRCYLHCCNDLYCLYCRFLIQCILLSEFRTDCN